ncbi:MAG TPA: glycerate kinase [Tepidisphaeraceae bacterium]|nr:glycerate kinase [Tepidisphaeraceae bacterium]
MRIIVAPDKFKDCLNAPRVAEAIAAGLKLADPYVQIDLCPMGDGGEGTVDALVKATNGRLVTQGVTGPIPGTIVGATMGFLGDGTTAVIEMAAASGLHLLRADERNPMRTTTYGTGELIKRALGEGARQIILGIGGSATVDGGLGALQACGAKIFVQREGANAPQELTEPATGQDLVDLESVVPPPEMNVKVIVACDVDNPLTGPNGAAAVFGPQKGSTPEQVKLLDEALARLAEALEAEDAAKLPGAGAAGGLGFAMLAFFGAEMRPGIGLVMEATGLKERLAKAELCITGEGKLDASSLSGKAPVGVAKLCREVGIPCIAIAGAVDLDAKEKLREIFTACFSICSAPMSLQDSIRSAPELLTFTAMNMLKARIAGKSLRMTSAPNDFL